MNQELLATIRLEDGSYWATVDAFPGVVAAGDAIDELRESPEKGIALYLSAPGKAVANVQLVEFEPAPLSTTASAELVCA